MKKVMVCIGIFFMFFGCVCLVGCQPKHQISEEWTVDADNHWHECLHCDEIFDLGTHTGGSATCTQRAQCEICGEEYGTLDSHEMGNVETREATIEEKGYTTHEKCNNCPYTEGYKEIPYLSILNNLTKEYDGEEVTAEDIQVAITQNYQPQISFSPTTPKNVGEYTVTVSILETQTNIYVETTQTFEITPKQISVTKNFEYNGQTTFTTTQDNFTFEVTFSSKNVNSTVLNTTITGENKDNYTFNTNFAITPKPTTGIFEFASTWLNRTGIRSFHSPLTADNGLIEGDSAEVYVDLESYDLNAPITEVYLIGTDAQNYSITKEQFSIKTSLKISIKNADETTKNFYVLYGDNKIYSDMKCTTEVADFSSLTLSSTYTIQTTDGNTLISSTNPSTMLANVEGITDANGNWIVPNGNDTTLTTFVLVEG